MRVGLLIVGVCTESGPCCSFLSTSVPCAVTATAQRYAAEKERAARRRADFVEYKKQEKEKAAAKMKEAVRRQFPGCGVAGGCGSCAPCVSLCVVGHADGA